MAKGATTWEDAMTNTLNAAMEKATGGKQIVDGIASKLPADLKPETKDSIDKTCHDSYQNIIDNINKKQTESWKNDPTSALKSYLSATSFSDCTRSLKAVRSSVA
ncbi:hypothetical protein Salat_1968500 [Sesamum alatum]|uniref:Uncharacterized protein n=1 Tax=Sesamum alatum TaxID=300844 RepID=A0AAE1Y617_9LAMI|nr:hypothetical protein Salat_1968500 [Sesamum alatum]